MKNLVLIMSSQLVDQDMRLEVGRIPPALIPLNGRPLYKSICERFDTLSGETEFCLVAHHAHELIERELRADSENRVRLLNIPHVLDLGEAVAVALEKIEVREFDNVFLNFGDTLVDADFDTQGDTIFYSDLAESYRWTTFRAESGKILQITDKGASDAADAEHVFTGVFLIKHGQQFLDCLRNSQSDAGLSRFYRGLEAYLQGNEYRLEKVKAWHDFGHADNYYQARKRFVNTRFFNEISIDESRAIVTKRSAHAEKLSAEIDWYREIPAQLKCYTPQIFDWKTGRDPFVSMEFYGYPTVAELFLNSGHDLGIWSHLFKNLFQMLNEMRRHAPDCTDRDCEHAFHQVYHEKTVRRLDSLRGHPILGRFFSHAATINGRPYQPLDSYLEQLGGFTSRLEARVDKVSVVHGDLCASNILYDPRSRIIKVIDPRGSFGSWSIYGDYRYDLAKLSHSFLGHYESIIHNRFFVLCDEYNLSFDVRVEPYQRHVSEIFQRHLAEGFREDLVAVGAIEALLFLSMIPLHSDYLNRQLAMLATGIAKLDDAFRSLGILG